MADQARQSNIRYTQAIVNQGREAGASFPHPTASSWACRSCRARSSTRSGRSPASTAGASSASPPRPNWLTAVVAANKDVVVVCPFWSGTPYEMLIIPTRHEAHLYDSPEADLAAVGRAIRDALTMLADRLGDVAYNLVFHTASHQHDGAFHWHVHPGLSSSRSPASNRARCVMINIEPPEVLRRSCVGGAGRARLSFVLERRPKTADPGPGGWSLLLLRGDPAWRRELGGAATPWRGRSTIVSVLRRRYKEAMRQS